MNQLRDWAGRKMTAYPGPAEQEQDPHDGVRIRTPEDYDHMQKAPRTTKYTLNGARYRIRKGDPIPVGAVLDEERSEKAAPENRAEKAAPQNRTEATSKAKAKD